MTDLLVKKQPGNNLANLNKTAKHGSYAHFPGSGPSGKFCERCTFYTEKSRGKGYCGKFKQIMGFKGGVIRGATQACKYFEDTSA